MEKHVYLVRHGESTSNADKIHYGHGAPLTVKGRDQAQLIAKRVDRLQVNALFCSDFPRAIETAEIIGAKINLEPIQNQLFGELRGPSSIEGKHIESSENIEAHTKIGASSDPHFRFHDEETFAELVERGTAALKVLSEHSAEKIVVVTHGGFLRLIAGLVLFRESLTKREFHNLLEHWKTTNTGLTYLTFDEENGWFLRTLNDQSHLG